MAVGFLFRLRLANLRVAVKQSSRETGVFKLLFVILLQTIEGLREIDTVLRVIK